MKTRREILKYPHQMTASINHENKFQDDIFYEEEEYKQNYIDGVNKGKVDVQVEIQIILEKLYKEFKDMLDGWHIRNPATKMCINTINMRMNDIFAKYLQSNPEDIFDVEDKILNLIKDKVNHASLDELKEALDFLESQSNPKSEIITIIRPEEKTVLKYSQSNPVNPKIFQTSKEKKEEFLDDCRKLLESQSIPSEDKVLSTNSTEGGDKLGIMGFGILKCKRCQHDVACKKTTKACHHFQDIDMRS
jgi:hypothetical protein